MLKAKFPAIANAVSKLNLRSTILDDEVECAVALIDLDNSSTRNRALDQKCVHQAVLLFKEDQTLRRVCLQVFEAIGQEGYVKLQLVAVWIEEIEGCAGATICLP